MNLVLEVGVTVIALQTDPWAVEATCLQVTPERSISLQTDPWAVEARSMSRFRQGTAGYRRTLGRLKLSRHRTRDSTERSYRRTLGRLKRAAQSCIETDARRYRRTLGRLKLRLRWRSRSKRLLQTDPWAVEAYLPTAKRYDCVVTDGPLGG